MLHDSRYDPRYDPIYDPRYDPHPLRPLDQFKTVFVNSSIWFVLPPTDKIPRLAIEPGPLSWDLVMEFYTQIDHLLCTGLIIGNLSNNTLQNGSANAQIVFRWKFGLHRLGYPIPFYIYVPSSALQSIIKVTKTWHLQSLNQFRRWRRCR